jgi:hypothetical protein
MPKLLAKNGRLSDNRYCLLLDKPGTDKAGIHSHTLSQATVHIQPSFDNTHRNQYSTSHYVN